MKQNKPIIFLNLDDQIKKLENDKKLTIVEGSKPIFKEYLKSYGYNHVVKSLKHKLMYKDETCNIFKPDFTSNNLRYLLDIDRNISVCFWKYFRSIEMLINSTIVKILYKFIHSKTDSPYICLLNQLQLDEIFDGLKSENPVKTKALYSEFFEYMTQFSKSSNWLLAQAKNSEKTISNNIKNKIDNFFIFNKKHKTEFDNNRWKYLEIFNISYSWTFSFCVNCFEKFSIKYKNEIITNFFEGYKSKKNKHIKLTHEDFSILLKILTSFRNKLAHNETILDFNGSYNNVDLTKIFNYFDIENPSDPKTFHLNDMLIVFEKIINKSKFKDEIEKLIIDKLTSKTERNDKISKLLFDIIEDFSKIELSEETKNLSKYNI